MQPRQHEHIRAVMQVAGEGRVLPSESARDVVIRESCRAACISIGWIRRACASR